jgi:hypothetical protein
MCNKVDDLKEAYKELIEIQKEAKLYADEIYIEQDEYVDLLMKKKMLDTIYQMAKDYEDDYSGYHLATKIVELLGGKSDE